jgi:selenocysteine lyase/cysteine desulfurase
LFCVDAIQQVGALSFDVQAIQADFVIADGHKWLLFAEGLGLFYVRREVMDKLGILQYGWHMTEDLGDYSDQTFKLANTARRFECGSPNMLGIHAMNASVQLLLETGMQNITERVLDNSRFLVEQLNSMNKVTLLTDTSENRLSGIVTFTIDGVENTQLYKRLSEKRVLCAPRGGGLRLSAHFYTPRNQLEQLIELVKIECD